MNQNKNSSTSKPVKLQSNDYLSKPLTPDTSTLNKNTINKYSYQPYGTINRSNSMIKKEDRPSTAPTKEKDLPNNRYVSNSGINNNYKNRLTSPQVKYNPSTNQNIGVSANLSGTYSGSSKYNRGGSIQPKPNMRLDNNSSFKGLDSNYRLGKL